MNAMPITPADVLRQDHVDGSDSDTNLEDDDAPEYYQPISAVDDDDEDSERNNESCDEDRCENGNVDAEFQSERLSNGHHYASQAENGMSSLSLHNDLERNKSSSEDEKEEEEEEARIGITPDSAITRAFREDENRRNAPLTPENAMRVMEAMRGISFSGLAPDWADQVPEDRWIDQLRRLRQPPQA